MNTRDALTQEGATHSRGRPGDRRIMAVGTLLSALIAAVGCDFYSNLDPCSSDADCGGFACRNPGDDGVCRSTCSRDEHCAEWFECNTDAGWCEPMYVRCVSDEDCGGLYSCDTMSGVCFERCTDGSECAEGAQCTGGACENIPTIPYVFAAVVSETEATQDDVSETSTPGPDVDAISYIQPGTGLEFFASSVANSVQGSVGDRRNEAANPQDATGRPDVFAGAVVSECNFDAGYWSMGANNGFGVFSFNGAAEFEDRGTITVYEISPNRCDPAASADPYSVWIGHDSVAVTADDIRDNWCYVGYSGAESRTTVSTIRLRNCPSW